MKKHIITILLLLFLTGCSDFLLLDFEKHERGANPYDPVIMPLMKGETDGSWVFMMYIDGANNLENAAVNDFKEMVNAPVSMATTNITIVVLIDRMKGYSTDPYPETTDWTDTRLYVFSKNSPSLSRPTATINGKTLSSVTTVELDMGNPDTLRDFIKWCINNYSADYYLLDIWNHGGGWRNYEPENTLQKAIAWDEETPDHNPLYMDEVQYAIRDALSQVGREYIDIIYMDACLMQMVEVAYELRDKVLYLVASEETVPGNGGDYTDILTRFVNMSPHSPYRLARNIVLSYRDQYFDTSDTTLSAVDVTKINNLKTSIDIFAQNLMKVNFDYISQARDKTLHFAYSDQADLYDFAYEINKIVPGGVPGAVQVMNTIDEIVIKEYHHGASMDDAHGIAIYLPPSPSETKPEYSKYNNLYSIDFINDSYWSTFIQWYKAH